MSGLVRTGPRIGPGSGCSWAPTRDRPMAPSRVGVVSRTAPEAMATGPPTREPPHLPTSLAGRSPEKLPRLVREVSGRGYRIFCLWRQGISPENEIPHTDAINIISNHNRSVHYLHFSSNSKDQILTAGRRSHSWQLKIPLCLF